MPPSGLDIPLQGAYLSLESLCKDTDLVDNQQSIPLNQYSSRKNGGHSPAITVPSHNNRD